MGFMGIILIMMIVIIPIAAGIVIIAIWGISAIILGLSGVVSTSLVKDKIKKRLMLISFFTLIVVGVACTAPITAPIMIMHLGLTTTLITVSILSVTLIVLGIFGVRISRHLDDRIAKILFRVIFFASIAASSMLIFLLIFYLLS